MKAILIMRSQSRVPGGAGVPGGQIGVVQLARALGKVDVAVRLFVGGPRMPYLNGLDGVETTYFRWPLRFDQLLGSGPARLKAFGADLRRRGWLRAVAAVPGIESADVIHVQGLQDTESLLTRFNGPLITTHWGRVGQWQPRGSSPEADDRLHKIRQHVRLVAIGDAQAEELAAAGMPPADVIPPGIDLHHFKPGNRADARQQVGFPADGSTVLYVGRLAADKNVDALLRAFARTSRNSRRARLLIIEDGPLRTALERLTHELGIGTATTFLPFVAHQDLPAFYQASDVTVVPSNYLETFCMVALEAIACGCPLIVTDQVPEILRRFPTVPSVAPYDVTALADQIDAALAGRVQPADITRIAEYGWNGVAHRYIDFYQTALRRQA